MLDESYPSEERLGENCQFWRVGGPETGCHYPKAELTGRLSCEGIVDDVCLFRKVGRHPRSLSEEQILEIKTRSPSLDNRFNLPPGGIT